MNTNPCGDMPPPVRIALVQEAHSDSSILLPYTQPVPFWYRLKAIGGRGERRVKPWYSSYVLSMLRRL